MYSEFDWYLPLAQQETIQCSTPWWYNEALYQNIFRGEPAISRFVWHIAPNLRSSQPIATDTGSVLLPDLSGTQPAQG